MNFFSSSGLPSENQMDRQNARQAPGGNITPRASTQHCSAGSTTFAPADFVLGGLLGVGTTPNLLQYPF
jgi:hypothetical protein